MRIDEQLTPIQLGNIMNCIRNRFRRPKKIFGDGRCRLIFCIDAATTQHERRYGKGDDISFHFFLFSKYCFLSSSAFSTSSFICQSATVASN